MFTRSLQSMCSWYVLLLGEVSFAARVRTIAWRARTANPAELLPHQRQQLHAAHSMLIRCAAACSAAAGLQLIVLVLHPHLIGEVERKGAQVQLLHQQQLLF